MSLRVRFHYDDLPLVKGCGPMTVRRHQRVAAERAGLEVLSAEEIASDADYDVLHANTISPLAPRLFAAARRRGALVVAHAHTTAEDMAKSFTLSNVWSRAAKPMLKRVYESADVIIAPSEYTRRLLLQYGIERPIHVVSNGVDLASFRPDPAKRRAFREAAGVTDGRTLAVAVGLVLERKGVRDFAAAAGMVPESVFAWAGDMPSPLISLAPMLRLAMRRAPDNCDFMGFVPEVSDVYRGGDLFAFPSHEENQGIVTLEAAASGLPLVLRDIPVYRGWIRRGEDALLFRDLRGFAEAVREVGARKELRERLSRAARKMAARHDLGSVGFQLREIYEEALARRQAA